jgi:hypothetical protein
VFSDSVTADLEKDGAPGEIRTPDQLVRSQLLYPAELQAHLEGVIIYTIARSGRPELAHS